MNPALLGLALLGSPALAAAPPAPVAAEAHGVEIGFDVAGRTIPGTFVTPAGDGPWPAVLLLAGSGPTDRDWNSPMLPGGHGAGRELAEHLAAHGVAVLRFDKAGSGKNPGPPLASWTFDTWRDEAAAALDWLRARPEVRADRVFVAGHSEGGIHATRLAQLAPDRLAGVLLLSSASRTMSDTMATQLESQLSNPQAGLSPTEVAAEMASIRGALAALVAGQPVDASRASRFPPVQALIGGMAATPALTGPLLGFDTAAQAATVDRPFLVVSGGKDVQVDPALDGQRLVDALRAAGRDVTFHLSVDADHLLRHEPRSPAELRADLVSVQNRYNAADRALEAEAARVIVDWLAARSR